VFKHIDIVPYEKGSLFLYFLETKVGGPKAMLEWLTGYYRANTGKSVSSEDFQKSFLAYFTGKADEAALKSINWDEWYYKPGLPAFDPTEKLQNKYTQSCNALAEKWLKNKGEGTSKDDFAQFSSKQKMYFMDLIITQGIPFPHELIAKMDSLYEFSKTKNVEMSFRYLLICLRSNYREALPLAAQFLSVRFA
jgi:leukotriene-A4 hydrolase